MQKRIFLLFPLIRHTCLLFLVDPRRRESVLCLLVFAYLQQVQNYGLYLRRRGVALRLGFMGGADIIALRVPALLALYTHFSFAATTSLSSMASTPPPSLHSPYTVGESSQSDVPLYRDEDLGLVARSEAMEGGLRVQDSAAGLGPRRRLLQSYLGSFQVSTFHIRVSSQYRGVHGGLRK